VSTSTMFEMNLLFVVVALLKLWAFFSDEFRLLAFLR